MHSRTCIDRSVIVALSASPPGVNELCVCVCVYLKTGCIRIRTVSLSQIHGDPKQGGVGALKQKCRDGPRRLPFTCIYRSSLRCSSTLMLVHRSRKICLEGAWGLAYHNFLPRKRLRIYTGIEC